MSAKLVDREPTPEMIEAGKAAWAPPRYQWHAMWDAAPEHNADRVHDLEDQLADARVRIERVMMLPINATLDEIRAILRGNSDD